MIKFLNWIFSYFGYELVKRIPTEIDQLADEFVKQVENKFNGESGEFKRSQVLRMLLNRFPTERESVLAMAIEQSVLRQ